MSGLTKEKLRKELAGRGIPLPSPKAKKEEYLRLYRLHVLNRSGQGSRSDDSLLVYSSDEDDNNGTPLQNTSRDSYRQNAEMRFEISEKINSMTDDELYENLKQYGDDVGPVVVSTRPLYEKRLQYLMNGYPPDTYRAGEFSASEEEEEDEKSNRVTRSQTKWDTSGDFTSQEGERNHSSVAFEFSSPKVTGQSRMSASQTTLRSRSTLTTETSTKQETELQNAPPKVDESKSKGISLYIKVLIVVFVLIINVMIYANMDSFRSTSNNPVPSMDP